MPKRYTSSLSDQQWALVEPLVPPERERGDRRTTDMRQVVDAILYVSKNGCAWRDLPGDFEPHWNTVYGYFNQWSQDGTWRAIYDALHRQWRKKQDRDETPSAVIIDSQSVKSSEVGGEARGYDGNKKIKGRKRHLMVTTEGFPIAVHVTAASGDDRHAGAMPLLERLCEEREERVPRLEVVWADTGYSGEPFAAFVEERGWRLELKHKPEGEGFQVLKWRWVVERTFAWLMKSRRLCRDYERLVRSVEAFIYVTMTRLLLQRLAPA